MNPNFLEFWYSALRSPKGVLIETDDVDRLKQRLYQARTKACDPDLSDISVVVSPTNPNHLWLVKKRPDADGS